jgi:4'-phosphopantetheinyl transferase
MNADPTWQPPPAALRLEAHEVHVWRVTLGATPEQLAAFAALLSEDERRQAERYQFPELRRRAVALRAVQRTLLGAYLAEPPGRLRFRQGPFGKPYLEGRAELQFNAAHSEALALFAFARGREVGVDLERIRPGEANELVAEGFFAAREAALLRALPRARWDEVFFTMWVCKEAFLKATGRGIAGGLHEPEIVLEPRPRLYLPGSPGEAARWDLRMLDPGPDFAAAVVAEGRDWSVRCWDYRF